MTTTRKFMTWTRSTNGRTASTNGRFRIEPRTPGKTPRRGGATAKRGYELFDNDVKVSQFIVSQDAAKFIAESIVDGSAHPTWLNVQR